MTCHHLLKLMYPSGYGGGLEIHWALPAQVQTLPSASFFFVTHDDTREKQNKKDSPTRVWTAATGFKVQGANHYTIGDVHDKNRTSLIGTQVWGWETNKQTKKKKHLPRGSNPRPQG